MAATKYGCVNRSTGEIEFDICSGGDYVGCIVRSGAHAGQVEVTISELGCSDTYYGCVNRATGKFQISVPDECCCSCAYTNACPDCFAENETPQYLSAIISSGIKLCSDDSEPFNDFSGCLEAVGNLGGAPVDCYWTVRIGSIWISYGINEDDTTEVFVSDDMLEESPDYYFIAIEGGAFGAQSVYNNDIAKVDCGGNKIGYDGTVTIGYPCA